MKAVIEKGTRLPDAEFLQFAAQGIRSFSTADVFQEGMVLVVGVVNAFGPVCSQKHLPEFIPYAKELVDNWLVKKVLCISASDPFSLNAWAEKMQVKNSMTLYTDKNANFATKLGLDIDLSQLGLGKRSTRYVMLVQDQKVVDLRYEEVPNSVAVTSKESVQNWLPNYV
ncbi:redoxin family protein [Planctobacterium marinum]|uniref:Peroxiredoxin n=1 Tax=Planctobacterium marinum TaxID=1631968 RepID=A0AA48HIP9_9ALTE|nr:peroxiredoxin [Planctobacterium marinum]